MPLPTFDTLFLQAVVLPENAIEVGRIAEPWGVKGWFKVIPYSSDPQTLLTVTTCFLQAPGHAAVSLVLREVHPHNDTLVAQAVGIDNRDAAQALRGARIFMERTHFPATQEGEYYWVDLLGLEVVNREGIHLGTVHKLLPAGPQTTLVLTREEDGKTQERLIPFVAAFVDQVDLTAHRIMVDWQADY